MRKDGVSTIAFLRNKQPFAFEHAFGQGRVITWLSTARSSFRTRTAALISAAFLFQFGTGPIRGFATTLTIGLLSNVFTAVFLSRTLFELVLSRRQVTKLSI